MKINIEFDGGTEFKDIKKVVESLQKCGLTFGLKWDTTFVQLNVKKEKELAGVNHSQDCSRELLENSNEDSNIRIDVLPDNTLGCGKEGIDGEGNYIVCGKGILCDECFKKKSESEVKGND